MKDCQKLCMLFFFTFLFACKVKSQAVHICSLEIIPSYPTEDDTVKIICVSCFPSSGCLLTSDSVNLNGLICNVYAYHDVGVLTTPCNSIDTFVVGKLNVGNYELIYHLGVFSTIYDTDTLDFTVHLANGIQPFGYSLAIKLSPNPTLQTININTLHKFKTLAVYNLQGSLIFKQNFSRQIDVSDLKKGMYVLELINENEIEKQRFIKE